MFVLLYVKNEIIFLSFLRLRKQDFVGTEKWLNRIPNIERNLVRKQQGYYFYLMGIIQSQKNLTQAEKHFKAALKLGPNIFTALAIALFNGNPQVTARRAAAIEGACGP